MIVRNPSGSSKAKTLWKLRDAKDEGYTQDDRAIQVETKLARRDASRRELWNAHLEIPTCAWSQALRKVETWGDADSSAGRLMFMLSLFSRHERNVSTRRFVHVFLPKRQEKQRKTKGKHKKHRDKIQNQMGKQQKQMKNRTKGTNDQLLKNERHKQAAPPSLDSSQ